jgi:hypothetical protein
MNAWQRKTLQELMTLCNELGGSLDYTATHYNKLRDRQQGLMKCWQVIYSVLTDHSENDDREDDRQRAEEAIEKLRELAKIEYPDRSGEILDRLTQHT